MEFIDLNGLTRQEVSKVKNFIISLKKVRFKSGAKRFQAD